MNKLPIFNVEPKPADMAIASGVRLFKPLLTEVYNDRDGFLIIIEEASTSDIMLKGQRCVAFDRGMIEPDNGNWFTERWQAELRGAELLIKRKDKMLDHITKQMGRAEKAKEVMA